MSEDYVPDVLSKFTLFRDKFESLSNQAEEELGPNHDITFQLDLLFARVVDLCDDVELLVAMNE